MIIGYLLDERIGNHHICFLVLSGSHIVAELATSRRAIVINLYLYWRKNIVINDQKTTSFVNKFRAKLLLVIDRLLPSHAISFKKMNGHKSRGWYGGIINLDAILFESWEEWCIKNSSNYSPLLFAPTNSCPSQFANDRNT